MVGASKSGLKDYIQKSRTVIGSNCGVVYTPELLNIIDKSTSK